jgi:hypothetical protein
MEALLARCLTDPDYLNNISRDPQALRHNLQSDLVSDAVHLDFQKLSRFSGFIGKVQHNYLWEHFRFTRHLMNRKGLDHDVFGEYRCIQLSESTRTLDREGRIHRFCEFFDGYLLRSGDWFLRTVFTHERTIWELGKVGVAGRCLQLTPGSPSQTPKPIANLIPFIPSGVRLVKLDYDPLKAVEAVSNGSSLTARRRRYPVALFYVRDTLGQVRSFKLDAFCGIVFNSINNRHSTRTLTTRLRQSGLHDVKSQVFWDAFESAAIAGLIDWREPA